MRASAQATLLKRTSEVVNLHTTNLKGDRRETDRFELPSILIELEPIKLIHERSDGVLERYSIGLGEERLI
jgi:hypothetical protein